MKVAVITARGGSKRIPRKNIRTFSGKPILAYGIEAALEAGLFDEVMVSTNDQEIAEAGRALGACVPFLRSEAASDDHATTADALIDVVRSYEKSGKTIDVLCCIYPTAPFITAAVLRSAYTVFVEGGFDSVFPIVRFDFPVWRSLAFDGRLVKPIWPQYYQKRSQDIQAAFHDAGQFYWIRASSLVESRTVVTDNSGAIEVSALNVQDIDTEEDWKLAELKFSLKKEEGRSKGEL